METATEIIAAHDPGGKIRHRVPAHWQSRAEFSDCGRYRYMLRRSWRDDGEFVMWLMMNPSTATEFVTDPTVAKCCRYAQKWGYGGILVGNVCAYRSTAPNGLLSVDDPVGPGNHAALLQMAADASLIVVAHGKLPSVKLQPHARAAVNLLRDAGFKLHLLRLSRLGEFPLHPLYQSESLRPTRWL